MTSSELVDRLKESLLEAFDVALELQDRFPNSAEVAAAADVFLGTGDWQTDEREAA